MKKCFVVSPIGNEGSETRKRADRVFKHIILPVCEKCSFEAIRVDQINQADSITQTIIDHLKNDQLVIADMTEHNPNAFYEMGYRASTGKPMIHLKEKGESIPFDISSIRAFDYDLTDLDAVDEIKERLYQTISAMNISEEDEEVLSENAEENTSDISDSVEQGVDYPTLLAEIYNIQDLITQLKNEIHNKDTETIQAIVKASQPTSADDYNMSLLKVMLPELLRNPNSMKTLIEIGNAAKSQKDDKSNERK